MPDQSVAPLFASWPHFESDDIEAASAVLRSAKVNYWGGNEGASFEREFADLTAAKYAIATSNGTTALEMALHGLRLQPGDEVIVPSRTYIATAACVVQRGGIPVCADIDRESGNITAENDCRTDHRENTRNYRCPYGRLAMRHGPDYRLGRRAWVVHR